MPPAPSSVAISNPVPTADPAATAAGLCLDCGLCCNGVLFDMVELQPGDLAKALTAKGLKIKKKRWFRQPCAALCDGTLCALYLDRPVRCRAFECRTYKAVAGSELSAELARHRIAEARRQVVEVESLLGQFDELQTGKPLAQRVANVLARQPAGALEKPERNHPPAMPGDIGRLLALEQEMARLSTFLDEHFRI